MNETKKLLKNLYNAYLKNIDDKKDLLREIYDKNSNNIALLYKKGLLSDHVFLKNTYDRTAPPRYNPSRENPLSEKGLELINTSWYSSLKESTPFQITRDIFAVVGGVLAVILTILQIKGGGS